MIGFAISGKAGSGKSTLARNLVEFMAGRGIPAVQIAFGDQLKREVWERYGVDKFMPGGRELLISYGERRRAEDPLYWVRFVAERARLAQVCGVLPVIDDVRFRTEYDWATEAGLTTIRTYADSVWRRARLEQQGLDGSIVESLSVTETELDNVAHDFVFRNGHGAPIGSFVNDLVGVA